VGSLVPILAKGFGVKLNLDAMKSDSSSPLAKLFSESTGRFVVITSDPEAVVSKAYSRGIETSAIGKVTKASYSLELDGLTIDLSEEIDRRNRLLYEVMG
jgi:AIR synthase related protein, C-terminal domain.